tara:strand:- start:31619 stop:34066 length:2448 start_codon:yes stop_codon:yes gene_type:complete
MSKNYLTQKQILQNYIRSTFKSLGQKLTSPDIILCLIVLLLAIFIYRDFIIAGKVDITPDTISSSVPFDQFTKRFQKNSQETPLWYPHIFSGMPYQASGSYHNLQYSFEALVNAIIPKPLVSAIHGRYFLHLILGAFAMYSLGRTLSLSRSACFVITSAFIFSTPMMATEHANRFICFMHIPLVFLATYRVFNRSSIFDAVLLGGAFGSQLCSFHPQIAFYTALLIGFYATFTLTCQARDKTPLSILLKNISLFTGGVVLAIAVAAVLVLPLQEYAQYSARGLSVGGNNVNVPFATSWSFPPIEILTFIIPSFSGFGGQLYWGDMPFTDFPHYLGIVVVVLAVLGAGLHRSRFTLFLIIAAALALLVSFGRHLPPVSYVMLNFVPFFGKFRAPVMILVILQFCLALLAGYGLNALETSIKTSKKTITSYAKRLIVIVGPVICLVLMLTLFETSFQSFMTNIYEVSDQEHVSRQTYLNNPDYHTLINETRFGHLINDLWVMVFFLCTMSILVLAVRNKKPIRLYVIGICALAVIDLLLVAIKVVNPENYPQQIEAYYAARENEIIKTLTADSSLYRILPIPNLNSNEYAYFGISTVGGYHPAKLGIYQELMDLGGLNSLPVLNMLNTRYLVSDRPLQTRNLMPVLASEDGYLYRNNSALPRAFLVDSVKIINDKNAIFNILKDPSFNPGEYAILEKPIDGTLGPLRTSTAEITEHTPHEIKIKVKADSRCLLVISEIYYPAGWHATIDGDPAEIYKTNYVLRSLIVPKGKHEVVLTFNPSSFTIGHMVSQIASSLIIIILVVGASLRIRTTKMSKP